MARISSVSSGGIITSGVRLRRFPAIESVVYLHDSAVNDLILRLTPATRLDVNPNVAQWNNVDPFLDPTYPPAFYLPVMTETVNGRELGYVNW
jgi:hypothetical protein